MHINFIHFSANFIICHLYISRLNIHKNFHLPGFYNFAFLIDHIWFFLKSTCLIGTFTCPRLSGLEIWVHLQHAPYICTLFDCTLFLFSQSLLHKFMFWIFLIFFMDVSRALGNDHPGTSKVTLKSNSINDQWTISTYIKMLCYQYRDSHYNKDKTVPWPSYP